MFDFLERSGSGEQHEINAHGVVVKGSVTSLLTPWRQQWPVSLMLNFKINVLLEDLADRFLCLGVPSWKVLPVRLEPSKAQLRMERCRDNG